MDPQIEAILLNLGALTQRVAHLEHLAGVTHEPPAAAAAASEPAKEE